MNLLEALKRDNSAEARNLLEVIRGTPFAEYSADALTRKNGALAIRYGNYYMSRHLLPNGEPGPGFSMAPQPGDEEFWFLCPDAPTMRKYLLAVLLDELRDRLNGKTPYAFKERQIKLF